MGNFGAVLLTMSSTPVLAKYFVPNELIQTFMWTVSPILRCMIIIDFVWDNCQMSTGTQQLKIHEGTLVKVFILPTSMEKFMPNVYLIKPYLFNHAIAITSTNSCQPLYAKSLHKRNLEFSVIPSLLIF